MTSDIYAWGILWRQHSPLDGYREFLIGDPHTPTRRLLFSIRQAARAACEARYGYIRERNDLRAEPHGWKMPTVAKVRIELVMERPR